MNVKGCIYCIIMRILYLIMTYNNKYGNEIYEADELRHSLVYYCGISGSMKCLDRLLMFRKMCHKIGDLIAVDVAEVFLLLISLIITFLFLKCWLFHPTIGM